MNMNKKSKYSTYLSRYIKISKSETLLRRNAKSSISLSKNLFSNIIEEIKLEEHEDNCSFENFVMSITKNFKLREISDICQIYKFLSKTELAKKFKNEMIGKKNWQDLLIYISLNIGHISKKKQEFLFHEGDVGDNFYIILQGKINIIISQPLTKYINADQYFQLLCEMENKEFYNLLLKTIKANHSIFPISVEDLLVLDLEEIHFRYEILNNVREKFDTHYLRNIFKRFNREPTEYFINFGFIDKILKTTTYYYDTIELFKEHFQRLFNSPLDLSHYRYLGNNEQISVTIYENQYFISLKQGEYFGDYALDSGNSKNTRKASIECAEDCLFGVINEETYKKYLYEEKRKIWEIELTFFLDNFFFHPIKKNVFQNEYYHFFQLCKENKRTTLFKEGDTLDYIYFLKEGEVELTININIADLSKLLDLLTPITKTKNEIYQMITKYQFIKNYLTKVQKHKVFNLNLKQEFGLIEYFYKIPTIYTMNVVSETAVLYKISLRNLEAILSKETSCKLLLKKRAKNSLGIIINRLVDIRNSMLLMIDQKNLLEKEIIKKMRKLSNEERKLSSYYNEPKILYQANFEPQIYSKISTDKKRNSVSNIPEIRPNEQSKLDSIFITNKKPQQIKLSLVENSTHKNDDDELNTSTVITPNYVQESKLLIRKKDIDKELKILNNFYEKTRKTTNQQNSLILPNVSINSMKTNKTKNNLPYSFFSQNCMKKSKSTHKIKLIKDSVILDYNEENLLHIQTRQIIIKKRNFSPKHRSNLSTLGFKNSGEF